MEVKLQVISEHLDGIKQQIEQMKIFFYIKNIFMICYHNIFFFFQMNLDNLSGLDNIIF